MLKWKESVYAVIRTFKVIIILQVTFYIHTIEKLTSFESQIHEICIFSTGFVGYKTILVLGKDFSVFEDRAN